MLNEDVRLFGAESYAGLPLNDAQGQPLGTIGIVSRQPLVNVERIESMLRIFAGRAAAEIEQLRAREALQRSEASYRAIFDAAEDAIVIHDWDSGAILDVNPKACAGLRLQPRRDVRLSLADISSGVEPYTAERALEHIAQATPRPLPALRMALPQPRRQPALGRGAPEAGDDQRPPPHLAFTRDITERKAALAALQAQEQQYRAIFDGSVDSMVLWSQELRIVDVNQAFVRMTGMTREQVIGKHWSERPDAQDMPRLIGYIEAALQGRETQAVEQVSRADGSSFHIELRYLPVRLGDTPYVLGVGRDVSERLENERALRASEAQYRGIFNASADALVLRAADFSIVDANATYERMSGFRLAEVLGVNRVLANPPEIMATHPCACTSGRWPARRSSSRRSWCGATANATTWNCAACRSSTAASRMCCTSGAT